MITVLISKITSKSRDNNIPNRYYTLVVIDHSNNLLIAVMESRCCCESCLCCRLHNFVVPPHEAGHVSCCCIQSDEAVHAYCFHIVLCSFQEFKNFVD